MRLTRLRIHDLRRHRDLDLALAPGLTVIRGANESGKSTVQRALELALFRKVTGAGQELEALRSWGAPDEARPSIDVEFVTDEPEGSRRGTLRKSFRGPKGTVELVIDGESTIDPNRADQLLAELTGIPSEAFYASTASIRHHEMDGLDRDEGALRDRLQASISGGDRGTSAAKKKLDKAIRELRAKGDKNPGRLRTAEEAVAGAEARLGAGEAGLAQLERDREAASVAHERRTEAEIALSERQALLEKARQAERISQERDVARERFERYRQAVAVAAEAEELRGRHPSATPLTVLRVAVGRLRVLEGEARELRATLGDVIDTAYEVAIPTPTWRPLAVAAVALVALGAGGASAGLVVASVVLAAGGGVVAAIGLLLGLYAWRQRSQAHDLHHQRLLRDEQIARRLRGRSELEAQLKAKTDEITAALNALALDDVAAAEALLAAEEAHVQAISQLEAQLKGLVGNEPLESLPRIRDAAALEIEQKTAALEALGPIAREPRARERLEVEVRDQAAALERARDDEATARARVEANSVDAEAVAGEAERLVGWRAELAEVQRRLRVYEVALEAIEGAERATMRTATRYLERRMKGDLERITGGRYRRVQIDDQTLDIKVLAPELGDWVDVRHLSQGTLDQVYLAARLGLVRLVTQDRRPPLVLDDPFVTFDDQRAGLALALLRELATDFQVIYLTCSDRYDALADAVVELPTPTERDAAEGETAAPIPVRPAPHRGSGS